MFANKYLSAGAGVPLLLVPGLICDSRAFQGQLAAFPGSAVGDYGDAGSIPEMARRVLASASERFVLIGHSMGARVALEIYRQAPERVGGLVLASTGVHAVRPGEREKRYALRDIGQRQGMAALVDAWLPPMLGKAASNDPALVDRLRTMCIDAGLGRFENQVEALLSRPEVEALLCRIAVPTLVVVGSEDQWAPPGQHAAFAALIPGAHFVVIEGAGHMLPAEKPVEINAAIAEWLGAPIAGQKIESKERIND